MKKRAYWLGNKYTNEGIAVVGTNLRKAKKECIGDEDK